MKLSESSRWWSASLSFSSPNPCSLASRPGSVFQSPGRSLTAESFKSVGAVSARPWSERTAHRRRYRPPMGSQEKALAASTMCEAFQITAAEWAETPALRLKDSDYEASWADYAETVRRRAAGLAALGVKRGDAVGFMLVNRPALHLTDAAAMHLGATCFSVYNTSAPEQVEYVVADAGNRVIVTEQAFLETVLAARGRVERLEHVVVIDGEAPEGTMSIEELEALGDPGFDFEAA